jgi:hypothetical protein
MGLGAAGTVVVAVLVALTLLPPCSASAAAAYSAAGAAPGSPAGESGPARCASRWRLAGPRSSCAARSPSCSRRSRAWPCSRSGRVAGDGVPGRGPAQRREHPAQGLRPHRGRLRRGRERTAHRGRRGRRPGCRACRSAGRVRPVANGLDGVASSRRRRANPAGDTFLLAVLPTTALGTSAPSGSSTGCVPSPRASREQTGTRLSITGHPPGDGGRRRPACRRAASTCWWSSAWLCCC